MKYRTDRSMAACKIQSNCHLYAVFTHGLPCCQHEPGFNYRLCLPEDYQCRKACLRQRCQCGHIELQPPPCYALSPPHLLSALHSLSHPIIAALKMGLSLCSSTTYPSIRARLFTARSCDLSNFLRNVEVRYSLMTAVMQSQQPFEKC
jgi:hypothetical protein